jgi:hypothetical protein
MYLEDEAPARPRRVHRQMAKTSLPRRLASRREIAGMRMKRQRIVGMRRKSWMRSR